MFNYTFYLSILSKEHWHTDNKNENNHALLIETTYVAGIVLLVDLHVFYSQVLCEVFIIIIFSLYLKKYN